jgi:aminoglycoside/choline kinase family phosphotransferase
MFMDTNNPSVIDYQDAVLGAVTYDLVSLLRDCYIAWPDNKVTQWALAYRNQAVDAGVMSFVNDQTFMRWFDLMGLQRHIKVLGIFARLYHRDGKENYLNDLPQTLEYVMQVGEKHPETRALIQLFNDLDIPKKI